MTQDEATVLIIAGQGEPMMPIGRWEKPVLELARRGLLVQTTELGHTITDEGRQALIEYEKQEDEQIGQFINMQGRMSPDARKVDQSLKQAAIHMDMAVRAAMESTGDSREMATGRLIDLLKQRLAEGT